MIRVCTIIHIILFRVIHHDQELKSKQLAMSLMIVIAGIIMIPFVIHPAEAHILKTFNMTGTAMPGMPSQVSVKIGWLNEPPLVGDT
ncbi:MAG: hypothetical protein ACRDFB_08380, partial [Rhabdochlamydiaceae bacterium]